MNAPVPSVSQHVACVRCTLFGNVLTTDCGGSTFANLQIWLERNTTNSLSRKFQRYDGKSHEIQQRSIQTFSGPDRKHALHATASLAHRPQALYYLQAFRTSCEDAAGRSLKKCLPTLIVPPCKSLQRNLRLRVTTFGITHCVPLLIGDAHIGQSCIL